MNRRHFLQTSTTAALATTATGAIAATHKNPSTRVKYEQVVALISAWRGKDAEAVLSHVTDDIAWHTRVGSPPVIGKEAMRKTLGALGAGMQDVRWRIFDFAANDESVFLEGVDDFVTTEGRRVIIPYAGVLKFRGKLIAEWRDYFDRGVFNKLKAGEPMPDYLDQLASRKALF